MLLLNDSLLVPTSIVVKNRIEFLNTMKHIACPWTITSLKCCSSVCVRKTEYCKELTKDNVCILSHHMVFWVLFSSSFSKLWSNDQKNTVWLILTFQRLYIYIYIYIYVCVCVLYIYVYYILYIYIYPHTRVSSCPELISVTPVNIYINIYIYIYIYM